MRNQKTCEESQKINLRKKEEETNKNDLETLWCTTDAFFGGSLDDVFAFVVGLVEVFCVGCFLKLLLYYFGGPRVLFLIKFVGVYDVFLWPRVCLFVV